MDLSAHQLVTRDFPHMTAEDSSLSNYAGFLHLPSGTYRVRVSRAGLRGDVALTSLLAHAPAASLQRVSSARGPHAALLELRDAAERAARAQRGAAPGALAGLPPARFYERLLSEARGLRGAAPALDEDLRGLVLRVGDARGRAHELRLALPPGYPDDAPVVAGAALPEEFRAPWGGGLQGVVAAFGGALARFQQFFDAMDDLDEYCWVLEPERPRRGDVHRRIAIGRHVSLLVELDPREPLRSVPECRFLGSEAAVGPLRKRLNESMHAWDTAGDVLPRRNLETVLGVSLPEAPDKGGAGADDLGMECGICYAYRLDDRVPELACDRPSCAKPFHRVCLVEWLQALPDTRQSFETLFGSCPYCEQNISVTAS